MLEQQKEQLQIVEVIQLVGEKELLIFSIRKRLMELEAQVKSLQPKEEELRP